MANPLVAPALLGGLGNIIGGFIGSSGQRDANRMNWQIARENRAFQERMSSTAYQRAAKDLESAGLNRILALGSPSSTPSGATATMQNPKAGIQKGIEQATNSALATRRLSQELKNMEAVEGKDQSQTDLNRAQEDIAAEEIQLKRQLTRESLQRTAGIAATTAGTIQNTAYVSEKIPGMHAEAKLWRFLNRNQMDSLAKAMGLSIPAARAAMMAARMIRAGTKTKK